MNNIKKLSDFTANQIAAGEVITEPLYVVKELIDNSIDANSTSISVEIKNHGLDLIEIKDNGIGIDKDDANMLFQRHATSKISQAEDLNNIKTLGFRGEALASIASVSKVDLSSKKSDKLQGFNIRKYADSLISIKSIPFNRGTTVTVRDLFFNTPARFSFLPNHSKIDKSITDYLRALALSRLDIEFKYVVDNKIEFITKKDESLIDRIFKIYGKEMTSNLLKFNYSNQYLNITGYISSLSYHRNNKNLQYTYINSRLTNNYTIKNAINEAYSKLLMPRRYPCVFLYVELDPSLVDVNIHPQKLEVKFKREILDEEDFINSIKKTIYHYQAVPNLNFRENDYTLKERNNLEKKEVYVSYNEINLDNEIIEDIDIIDIIAQKETQQKNIIDAVESKEQLEFVSFISRLNYVGSAFDSFLIFEASENLYFFDQHAAHEKILFEKFFEEYKNKEISSQIILFPIIIGLNKSDINNIEKNRNKFEEIGYELDFFDNDLVIRAIPSLFTHEQAKVFMMTSIEELNNPRDFIIDEIITKSCKAAIKAHDKTDILQAKDLIEKLKFLNDPMNCPHGRPIFIKVSKYDIERRFARIL